MELYSITEKTEFFKKVFGAMDATNKGNIQVKCPKCEDELRKEGIVLKKRKLAIDLLNHDRFHCWVCGESGKSLIRLIRIYKSNEIYGEYLRRFATEDTVTRDEEKEGDEEKKVVLPNDFRLLVTQDYNDRTVRFALEYLKKRGVRYKDLWYYKFGISDEWPWQNRVIMPSFDADGNLNYLCGRDVTERQKFSYCDSDVPKKNIVFNELNIDWNEELTITEGIFDLIKCNRNSVPVLGSDLSFISLLFMRIVQNNTPVLLALDNDMKGSKIPKIAQMLIRMGVKVRVLDHGKPQDVGDMSRKDFLTYRSAAKVWDFEARMKDKISRIFSSAVL